LVKAHGPDREVYSTVLQARLTANIQVYVTQKLLSHTGEPLGAKSMEPRNFILAMLLRREDNSYGYTGTGFLVNGEGLFLSAAHVFKEGNYIFNKFYCCFPSDDSELYPLEFLKYEYLEKDDQRGPIYKDFAVGKIDYQSEDYLILKRKRPLLNAKQTIYGYVNAHRQRNNNRFLLNDNERIDLTDIEWDQPFETVIQNRYAIISTNTNDYERNESHVESRRKYNNCISLKRASHRGVSGGPIINENGMVSGIYVGGPETHRVSHAIAARYAGKRIKKMTKIKFDRYQDIK